ncbi:MAG TPA: hypothetical protein VK324_11890, partial [Tepidisphaeraceae bacterium]|nr:hypothetical protein [Tepidisphaeraceae bacterium]
GMQFMKYHLANVAIPPTHTASHQVMADLYAQLQASLENTPNMGTKTISLSSDGMVIQIPSSGSIPLDRTAGGPAFIATLNALPNVEGKVTVSVAGAYGTTATVGKSVSMDFIRKQIPTSVWNAAIASAGQVHLSKGDVTSLVATPAELAKITAMSALLNDGAAIHVDGGSIGGYLSVVDGSGVWFISGNVGGDTRADLVAQHTTKLPSAPAMPVVDATVFRPLATTTYPATVSGAYRNCRIPPNTNPKFTGNDTIEGILYVESPNQVEFQGNCTINGYVVFANGANDTDSITMTGNMAQNAVPNGSAFDSVRTNNTIAILAPTADLKLTGSAGGTNKPSVLLGSVIVDTFSMRGASGITISHGTLVTLDPTDDSVLIDTSKWLKFDGTGAENAPQKGISYASYFSPQGFSYTESTVHAATH